MPSTSESSTESPGSKLPYDILQQIFTNCLPQYPLLHRQPDTRIAPILLCHICSSWRTAALSTTTLWTHLSYSLNIKKDDSDVDAASSVVTSRVPSCAKRDLEFIQWWRTHHGPISPFLKFSIDARPPRGEVMERLTGETEARLLDYIASAQYLELDALFWDRIYESVPVGYQLLKLHTLIAAEAWGGHYRFHRVLQHHALPALRLPSLEWGNFDIESLTSEDYTAPATGYSLPQLATLRVAVHGNIARSITFPLHLLFTHLHLPALHTLSLSAPSARSRTDQHAILELHGVLRAAPALTTLVLEDEFRTLHTNNAPAMPQGAMPIWTPAPQLARVHLALPLLHSIPGAQRAATLDLFVRSVVSPGTAWLDLPNPACPIRSVAICGDEISDHVRELLLACIQKYATRVPNVVFDITSDDAVQVAEDVRNEWGARI